MGLEILSHLQQNVKKIHGRVLFILYAVWSLVRLRTTGVNSNTYAANYIKLNMSGIHYNDLLGVNHNSRVCLTHVETVS